MLSCVSSDANMTRDPNALFCEPMHTQEAQIKQNCDYKRKNYCKGKINANNRTEKRTNAQHRGKRSVVLYTPPIIHINPESNLVIQSQSSVDALS